MSIGKLFDGTDALDAVKRFLSTCLSMGVKIKSAVIFGSRARGRWKEWSDIDVLIVAEGLPKERIRPFLHGYSLNIEPWPYEPFEVLSAVRAGDIAAIDALENGVVVFDDGTWASLKKEYEVIKEELGIVEDGEGWLFTKLVPIKATSRSDEAERP